LFGDAKLLAKSVHFVASLLSIGVDSDVGGDMHKLTGSSNRVLLVWGRHIHNADWEGTFAPSSKLPQHIETSVS
jgi:hypothetical protein